LPHVGLWLRNTGSGAFAAHGFPRQSSRKMIELLTSPATHTRRSGKLVLLMHDNMVQTAKAAAELTRIIDGVRTRGVNFGKIADY
jgi:hypothetical protein